MRSRESSLPTSPFRSLTFFYSFAFRRPCRRPCHWPATVFGPSLFGAQPIRYASFVEFPVLLLGWVSCLSTNEFSCKHPEPNFIMRRVRTTTLHTVLQPALSIPVLASCCYIHVANNYLHWWIAKRRYPINMKIGTHVRIFSVRWWVI